MKEEILEMIDIENELKEVLIESEVENIPKPKKPAKKNIPIPEKNKIVKKTKYIYKITNKTFQPIQLVISEKEMILLGSRKKDNVVFIKHTTEQIINLEKKGMIKIRKMS